MKLDEHPKPKTTIEQLAKLPPVFKKGGVVTAGGASGIQLMAKRDNNRKKLVKYISRWSRKISASINTYSSQPMRDRERSHNFCHRPIRDRERSHNFCDHY